MRRQGPPRSRKIARDGSQGHSCRSASQHHRKRRSARGPGRSSRVAGDAPYTPLLRGRGPRAGRGLPPVRLCHGLRARPVRIGVEHLLRRGSRRSRVTSTPWSRSVDAWPRKHRRWPRSSECGELRDHRGIRSRPGGRVHVSGQCGPGALRCQGRRAESGQVLRSAHRCHSARLARSVSRDHGIACAPAARGRQMAALTPGYVPRESEGGSSTRRGIGGRPAPRLDRFTPSAEPRRVRRA